MRRLALCLAVTVAAFVIVPVALADGPPPLVAPGGLGVATRDGAFHYVAVPNGNHRTLLEKIEVANGQVNWWMPLKGLWGTPQLAVGVSTGQGLSWDGRTIVLSSLSGPYASTSRFLVVNLKEFRAVRTITLHGSFSFDALSPDASRLYLIQYTHGQAGDLSHYIVRGYDLRTGRLMPGRIADRTQKGWVMKGSPLMRTWSARGRWAYTLYTRPDAQPFIHALNTRDRVAHCIDLKLDLNLNGAVRMTLSSDGKLLVIRLGSTGKTLMTVPVPG